MDEGFLLDVSDGAYRRGTWVAGPAEKSFWTGVKLHGRDQMPVCTYRCRRCGYLESYARPEA
jgi:hypothetical protein